MTRAELARRIDHTILKTEAGRRDIDRLCDECLQYGFAAACVQPVWVAHCARRLAGSQTAVCSVVGFPHGASLPESKAFEAERAVAAGAREIDMVVYLGDLIAGESERVRDDIATVVRAIRRARSGAAHSVLLKVILETRALSDEQIMLGCRCARDAGADFVKTSTGFHPAGGATVAHVTLMKGGAAPLRVKASGGIRDLKTAEAMLAAGADRLGMSASVEVVNSLAR